MVKRYVSSLLVLAAALLLPATLFAAALPGAAVTVVNAADGNTVATTATDADGAFLVENLPAGSYWLVVASADFARTSSISFAVAVEQAPARLRGRVTASDTAEISLDVDATTSALVVPDVVLAPGFPMLQRVWNLNWAHAMGNLVVRLAGTGLDAVTQVTLSSTTGTLATTRLVLDPVTGTLAAIFPKGAAVRTLVPAGAKRGDTVAIQVGVVTAAGTQLFDRTVRIVGMKAPKHRP